MLRRFISFVIIACCSSAILVSLGYHLSWPQIAPLAVWEGTNGPAEQPLDQDEDAISDMWPGQSADVPKAMFKEPEIDSLSPYPIGKTKPPGSNYTRALVLPRLKSESTAWVQQELGDWIDSGLLIPAVYTVDDRTADLHPPKNKGHEVMVYLSYIIDFYDTLPDISIFMHAHRYAWHNNELLNTDAAQMVRHLSPERVTREGYMNLRCHWDPGCPVWLHPGATKDNYDKPEEHLLADCWSELFPMDPVPKVLAQPCCAQFAVSRERILETPKMRYVVMRDWLIRTELTDYLSGRIFEHIWQYIFTASPIHCPSMSACYCDGYGLCFGGPKEFDYYFELNYHVQELQKEFKAWRKKADAIAKATSANGNVDEAATLEIPEVGKDRELLDQIEALESEMRKLKDQALIRGQDPKQRAIESKREWKDGEGF
ncbi:hypothetical protein CB0940_01618 [Cercospora beticola]|uniref:Uncharacterized protein n=1 Tax=Cercospora beticola TaxID=122368 RepID=A0A2G5I828_CERBT|nr:hypothetical protein CB0940_01618 [Cercospora beticola]PIB00958.1 hypothetical protein CB0940_01618 [Cercospora beticola]WPA97059.1 hypothetical protein RHO25_001667 [Cercospora beticola]CAK1354544.1 unnamed protein product [Cercospora beticola]